MADTSWAEWLRDQLADRDWKQADLVRKSAGLVTSSQVSNWLKGKYGPDLESIRQVCKTFGVSIIDGMLAAGLVTADEVDVKVIERPPRPAAEPTLKELLDMLQSRLEEESEHLRAAGNPSAGRRSTVKPDAEQAEAGGFRVRKSPRRRNRPGRAVDGNS